MWWEPVILRSDDLFKGGLCQRAQQSQEPWRTNEDRSAAPWELLRSFAISLQENRGSWHSSGHALTTKASAPPTVAPAQWWNWFPSWTMPVATPPKKKLRNSCGTWTKCRRCPPGFKMPRVQMWASYMGRLRTSMNTPFNRVERGSWREKRLEHQDAGFSARTSSVLLLWLIGRNTICSVVNTLWVLRRETWKNKNKSDTFF